MGTPFELDQMIEIAKQKAEVLKAIAVWTFHMAAKHLPEPPDQGTRIDPLAVSLKPEKWEEEGLFTDDGGMTLQEAMELLPGIDEYDLEARGARLVQ